MSIRLKGTNSAGHMGWFTRKCVRCQTSLRIGTEQLIYRCTTPEHKDFVYLCSACSRSLGMKCLYCGHELELVI